MHCLNLGLLLFFVLFIFLSSFLKEKHCIFREMLEFEQSFYFACPKFLSPVPPNYDETSVNYHKVSIVISVEFH